MSATDDALLLEREREVTWLSELLAGAASGRGGMVVIEGPAGIGKTRLLRHARALADGFTVLTASGSELEHDFGFGVVRQLLERAAPGHLEDAAALAAPALGLWPGAYGGGAATPAGAPSAAGAAAGPSPAVAGPAGASWAAGAAAGPSPAVAGPAGASWAAGAAAGPSPAVAGPAGASSAAGAAAGASPGAGDPAGASAADARFAALHGLYWLVVNLAAERPLLLAVDDAQWADEPSLRFLAYLARRARELPVALVLAARPPLPGEDRSILETIAADAGEPLALAPLSRAGVGALAQRRFGVASPAFIEACLRATGGNALLVEAVLDDLDEPDAGAVEAAGTERVGRRIARRLVALGDAAGPLAAAVAVLGDGYELALAAELAGVELADARRAAAELAAADVLDDAAAPRFRHPLVRAAVTERLPAVELGRAHARAARLLADREAPPGAIAAHLLLAPPAGEAWVPESLRHAARDARGQGAPELAAAYLRRALAEPPADRTAVLLELGRAEHASGASEAASRLETAWRATDDPQIALELATLLYEQGRWREATTVARDALAALTGGARAAPSDDEASGGEAAAGGQAAAGGEVAAGGEAAGAKAVAAGGGLVTGLAGDERELALRLFALLGDSVRMDPSIEGDEPERLRALAATLAGETAAERYVLAAAAVITPTDTADEHARAAELARRTRADAGRFADTGVVSNLIRAGRLDTAHEAVEEALDAARGGGFIQRHATMLAMRGWIWLERGALAEARDDLESALALAPDVALPAVTVQSCAALLAVVLAEEGELAHADELLETHGLAGEMPAQQVMNLLLYFRARVRMLQGRADEALADARAVGERYARLGLRRSVPPWRSQAAILSGDQELAEEELELAERWGTPLARGLALRGLGLVTGDDAALHEAVAQLEASPNRLELARARVDLGAALRRAGRRADARAPLRAGMDQAHACGAHPLAERARTELLATGARPRRLALQGTDALTPSEKRIATLAANGLTNRQIAQELFVTTATVETHLRHAFRKLDVRARGELASALRRPA